MGDVLGGVSGFWWHVLPYPAALHWLFSGSLVTLSGGWFPLATGDAAGSSTYGVYRPAFRHRGGTW